MKIFNQGIIDFPIDLVFLKKKKMSKKKTQSRKVERKRQRKRRRRNFDHKKI